MNPEFEQWPSQEKDPGADKPRLPDEWRIQYEKRPPDKLAKDVTHLFDREWLLERANDRLTERLQSTQEKLKSAKLQLWIMSLIVSPILGILFKALWEKLTR